MSNIFFWTFLLRHPQRFDKITFKLYNTKCKKDHCNKENAQSGVVFFLFLFFLVALKSLLFEYSIMRPCSERVESINWADNLLIFSLLVMAEWNIEQRLDSEKFGFFCECHPFSEFIMFAGLPEVFGRGGVFQQPDCRTAVANLGHWAHFVPKSKTHVCSSLSNYILAVALLCSWVIKLTSWLNLSIQS